MLRWGLAAVAMLAGLLWGAHLSVWWWAERDLGSIQAQRSLLLAKVVRRGPARRLCVLVDEAGQYGDPPDYRVILGY